MNSWWAAREDELCSMLESLPRATYWSAVGLILSPLATKINEQVDPSDADLIENTVELLKKTMESNQWATRRDVETLAQKWVEWLGEDNRHTLETQDVMLALGAAMNEASGGNPPYSTAQYLPGAIASAYTKTLPRGMLMRVEDRDPVEASAAASAITDTIALVHSLRTQSES